MSRHNDQRLHDIVAAADAITDHIRRGGLEDGLVFDAVRIRLIEIGEAVKGFDTAHSIVHATITDDLPPLVAAVRRLLDDLAR